MSTDAQKQWIERRKSEAKNRHQGRLQVPGTSPKIHIHNQVLKKILNCQLHGIKLNLCNQERDASSRRINIVASGSLGKVHCYFVCLLVCLFLRVFALPYTDLLF